ncbi:MAG: hypothetical protein V3W04_03950 [Gammaproteobacteria bacterium]
MKLLASLFFWLCVALPAQAGTNVFMDMMSMMFRMMILMANIMSTGTNTYPNQAMPVTPFMAIPNPANYPAGIPANPWSISPQSFQPTNPWSTPYLNYPENLDFQAAPVTTPLEGFWISSTGDTLIVRGQQFKLGHGQQAITGTLTLQENIVSMRTHPQEAVNQYRFERKDNFLGLQSRTGQVTLFTRRNTW